MDSTASFRIEERTMQPIDIECNANEEMKQIFKRLAIQEHTDINELEFYFNNKLINRDSKDTIIKLRNNKNAKSIIISVKKLINLIKCPYSSCTYNCLIRIRNYRLYYSKCYFGHASNGNIEDYETSQKIDYSKIKCNNSKCNHFQINYLKEFYKCLQCSQTLDGLPRYYCFECSKNHDPEHKNSLIKYNQKYYYCRDHCIRFIGYCKKCKNNLCDGCINDNSKCQHQIKNFDSCVKPLMSDASKIKEGLEQIKKKTKDLKLVVDEMRNILNSAVGIIEKYYSVATDLINKYESNKNVLNYQIIKTIKNLSKSNIEVMEDLFQLTSKNNSNDPEEKREIWINKFDKLVNIYFGYRDNLEGKIKENENNFDDDSESDDELYTNYINSNNGQETKIVVNQSETVSKEKRGITNK